MIDLQNVCKTYDEEEGPVFDGFSAHVDRGEFILVTGKSGSGKSTLIKMLLKEVEPDRGSIFVDGKELSKIPRNQIPAYRRGIGVVFQDFRLFDDYTVYGNLDPASSAEIFRLMEVAHRQGTTVVMATHDLATAERLKTTCRRIDLDLMTKRI